MGSYLKRKKKYISIKVLGYFLVSHNPHGLDRHGIFLIFHPNKLILWKKIIDEIGNLLIKDYLITKKHWKKRNKVYRNTTVLCWWCCCSLSLSLCMNKALRGRKLSSRESLHFNWRIMKLQMKCPATSTAIVGSIKDWHHSCN